MKHTLKLATLSLSAALLAGLAGAQTISVFGAIAPNAFGSPSFDGFSSNVITALQTGANMAGDPTQPTYYQNVQGQTLFAGNNIATGFKSYKGSVAAASGAFANELGNRATFPVKVVSANSFVLNDFYGQFFSTDKDGANGLSDPQRFYFTGSSFGANLRGLSYGADGIKGTGDDIMYNAGNVGSDMTAINELLFRGDGVAFEVQDTASFPGNTQQEKINNEIARIGGYSLSEEYGFRNGPSARGTINFSAQPVPEPASMAALGLGALALLKRRKKAAK